METGLTLMYRTCTIYSVRYPKDRVVNNTPKSGDVPSLIVDENYGLNLFVDEQLVK
jgi:hypothetical protein